MQVRLRKPASRCEDFIGNGWEMKLLAYAIETLLFLGLAGLVAYVVFRGMMWIQEWGYDYEKRRSEMRRVVEE
jgi:hypothetical protein